MAGCYLPKGLRARVDPEDIVQETLLRAFTKMETFVPRCEGAFIVYLRRILLNVIADVGRKEKRSPGPEPIEADVAGHAPSPVAEAVGQETWERYRAAVTALRGQRRPGALRRVRND
jgi:DNA-directed RNA polymerase specialized sigma24 family protein